MIETNPMIHFSILWYEFVKSMIITKTVISIAPILIGTLKSISNAIAPPSDFSQRGCN